MNKEIPYTSYGVQALPWPVSLFHTFILAGEYLYAGCRTDPSYAVIYAPDTPPVITDVPLGGFERYNAYANNENAVYSPATKKVYANYHNMRLLAELTINEDLSVSFRPVIYAPFNPIIAGETKAIFVVAISDDGETIYTVLGGIDGQMDYFGLTVTKYTLGEEDGDGFLIPKEELIVHDYSFPHYCGISDGILYIAGGMSAWVVKVDISGDTMAVVGDASYPDYLGITDDLLIHDGFLYLGVEFSPIPGGILVIDAETLSIYKEIVFGGETYKDGSPVEYSCYGVFYYRDLIVAVLCPTDDYYAFIFIGTYDPVTGIINTYTTKDYAFHFPGVGLPGDVLSYCVAINEVLLFGDRLYLTTWSYSGYGLILSLEAFAPRIKSLAVSEVGITSIALSWDESVNCPLYRVQVSLDAEFSAPLEYQSSSPCMEISALNADTEYYFRVNGLKGEIEGAYSSVVRAKTLPLLLELEDTPPSLIGLKLMIPPRTKALITMQSGLVSYTFVVESAVAQTIHEALLPNMFPGEKTTITLAVGDLVALTTFMAAEVAREVIESSGITRLTEDKQSIVYARGSGAYAILTTSSGYNNKYGVLAFVINEDNEIVLNDSMTSDYLYSDLSVSGEKPFLLNDETPFGVNLKYAWRGSNTDALEICAKLCLQGE